MIERTKDAELISAAVAQYNKVADFEPSVWVQQDKNIALTNGGDVSLFQFDKPGIFIGHWFFISRGRAAKKVAVEMLDTLFHESDYPVEVIIGLTPLSQLGARWLARHIGFKSQGVVTWNEQNLEFFLLTKHQWNHRQ
jgi:hypothetical protein